MQKNEENSTSEKNTLKNTTLKKIQQKYKGKSVFFQIEIWFFFANAINTLYVSEYYFAATL